MRAVRSINQADWHDHVDVVAAANTSRRGRVDEVFRPSRAAHELFHDVVFTFRGDVRDGLVRVVEEEESPKVVKKELLFVRSKEAKKKLSYIRIMDF